MNVFDRISTALIALLMVVAFGGLCAGAFMYAAALITWPPLVLLGTAAFLLVWYIMYRILMLLDQ